MKCRVCGMPYKIYLHFCGDQSACPSCLQQIEGMLRDSEKYRVKKHPGLKWIKEKIVNLWNELCWWRIR